VAKANDGAPGVDGVTFEAIETAGVETLKELHIPSSVKQPCELKTYPVCGDRACDRAYGSARGNVLEGSE
jgi:hypothetical protein